MWRKHVPNWSGFWQEAGGLPRVTGRQMQCPSCGSKRIGRHSPVTINQRLVQGARCRGNLCCVEWAEEMPPLPTVRPAAVAWQGEARGGWWKRAAALGVYVGIAAAMQWGVAAWQWLRVALGL